MAKDLADRRFIPSIRELFISERDPNSSGPVRCFGLHVILSPAMML
jgi:hypothetical protein